MVDSAENGAAPSFPSPEPPRHQRGQSPPQNSYTLIPCRIVQWPTLAITEGSAAMGHRTISRVFIFSLLFAHLLDMTVRAWIKCWFPLWFCWSNIVMWFWFLFYNQECNTRSTNECSLKAGLFPVSVHLTVCLCYGRFKCCWNPNSSGWFSSFLIQSFGFFCEMFFYEMLTLSSSRPTSRVGLPSG